MVRVLSSVKSFVRETATSRNVIQDDCGVSAVRTTAVGTRVLRAKLNLIVVVPVGCMLQDTRRVNWTPVVGIISAIKTLAPDLLI
jgi:hypothetical protein